MNRALIASSSGESANQIEQLLRAEGFTKIALAQSGNEARRLMTLDTEPKLIVISAPLSDEFGHELAVSASEYTSAGIILICGSDIAGEISDALSESGIAVIPRSSDRQPLIDALRAASEAQHALHGTQKENADILTKIDEMRLINKAKCRLMQYLSFTEHQAHKYIEKQAMNNRQTRLEAAEKILAQYDK